MNLVFTQRGIPGGNYSLLSSAAPLEPHHVLPFAIVCWDATTPGRLAPEGE